jgi:hypothetical protein
MKTKWRIIPSFPDYEASSDGRIRRASKRKARQDFRREITRRLAQGYHVVTLMKPSASTLPRSSSYTPAKVNRLVCEAFHGSAPSEKHHAAHKDGDALNDAFDNLYWAPPAQNAADKERHGTILRGGELNHSKLTDDAVRLARKERTLGATWAELASAHGVSIRAIRNAVNGETWKHV